MAENNEMKTYDFIEGTEFNGLMPKAMKGYSTGKGAGYSHLFRFSVPDALEVVSIDAIFEAGSKKDDSQSGSTIVKPTEVPNNEEQEQAAQDMVNALTDESGGTKAYSAVIPSINNLTVPADAGRSATVSGDVQNGATFTNESTGKYVTITGTQDEPVDVSIVTSGGAVYLRGEYNDIYLEGKSISISSSMYPNVHGTVSVADTNQPVTVNANFVGEDCGVEYLGKEKLTVTDGNTGVTASPTIYAPNATVEMGGKYDDVTVTVSDNTLILKSGFHAKSLNVLKGKVVFYGVDFSDFVDELISVDTVVSPMETEVTADNFNKLYSTPGIYKIADDIEVNKGISFGILTSGKYRYDLNGHTVKCGTKSSGSLFVRGTTPQIDIVGEGKLVNNAESYGVWLSAERGVINVYGGDFEAYTHVLYAEKGVINVYGGTFKMLGENADKDVNGNYKFLLNCLDASYTAGTAKINVYGGKFYEFNPSVSYGEPGGPVNFVAEGYKVVESEENGVKVYEVVKE